MIISRIEALYYVEESDEASSETGLYLKLDDGRVLRHQSTDYIVPFEEPKNGSEVVGRVNKLHYER